MIWLLDTNVLIHAVRGRPPAVRKHLQQQSPDDLAISSITIAELWYGAEKSPNPARTRAAWEVVLAPFQVIAFDRGAAQHHARIRYLTRHRPIGERDLLIAGIVLANDLTLVTHNAAEFSRVPQLRVEDWATI